jgi:hypothetical protein
MPVVLTSLNIRYIYSWPVISVPDCSCSLVADNASAASGLTGLDALPLQVINLIFAKLNNLDDLFAVGYSLPSMWPAATRHALELLTKRSYGAWAGVPIISVGNGQHGSEQPEDDYPQGLLSAADLRELRLGLAPPWQARTFGRWPASLYMIASRRYDFAPGVFALPDRRADSGGLATLDTKLREWGERMYRAQQARHIAARSGGPAAAHTLSPTCTLPQAMLPTLRVRADARFRAMQHGLRCAAEWLHQQQQQEAAGSNSVFFPTNEAWVLRNLTTREIVRADALARQPSDVRGPFVRGQKDDDNHYDDVNDDNDDDDDGGDGDNRGRGGRGICFGDVVALRTRFRGYNADPTMRLSEHEGVWAGHRFDITTVERHQREQGAQLALWADVSTEVSNEMKGLWMNRFGRSW